VLNQQRNQTIVPFSSPTARSRARRLAGLWQHHQEKGNSEQVRSETYLSAPWSERMVLLHWLVWAPPPQVKRIAQSQSSQPLLLFPSLP